MSEFIGKLDFIDNPPTKEELEQAAELIQKIMTKEEQYKRDFALLWDKEKWYGATSVDDVAYNWFKIGYEIAEQRAKHPPVSTDDSEVTE